MSVSLARANPFPWQLCVEELYCEDMGGMYDFAAEPPLDLETLRARLRRMSDEQLIRFGASARYMCSRRARWSDAPKPAYIIQLEEAVAEWKRRHGGEQTGPDTPPPDCTALKS